MSASTHVRETIELLCTVLYENGTSPLTAENFRLAKFNKDEAAPAMWTLLFELIYYCKYGIIDDTAVKAVVHLNEEEKCVMVKQELQSRGYLSHDFAHLSNNCRGGSRELLLALAWLLCKEAVVERFMDKCTSPLDDDMSHWCKDWPSLSASGASCSSMNFNMSPGQRVQRLLMLNGKLRLNLRRMYATQQQEAKMRSKIENSTRGTSLSKNRDSLSVLEVHMLRHPQLLQRMLVLLDKDNERLNNLLSWKEHEDAFWKWMDSVLDLKVKVAEREGHSGKVRSGAVYLNVPVDGQQQMLAIRQQLVKAILSYERSIENIEHLWEVKRHDVSTHELDKLIAAINMDIYVHKANLMLTRPDVAVDPPTPEPTLRLAREATGRNQVKGRTGQTFGVGEQEGENCDGVNVLTERLETQIRSLRSEVGQMHRDCQKTMMGLAQHIPRAICIEPPICVRLTNQNPAA